MKRQKTKTKNKTTMKKATTKEELTLDELSKVLYQTQIAKCILANQHALELNERLTGLPGYKFRLKQLGQPFIKELIKYHKSEYLKVEDAAYTLPEFKNDDVIDTAFDKSERIISLLTKLAFLDYDQAEDVLMALGTDPNSIHGIAKKINRQRK